MKDLTNEQKQVILSGILGDGSLRQGRGYFSCIHKEYMELKKQLLGDIGLLVTRKENSGYKKGAFIYTLHTLTHPQIKQYENYTISQVVDELDELGIALWLMDDGSRHKKNNFYNINTHAQTREVEEEVLIPFFNKLNIYPKILTEAKKDGRVFSYLYISKWEGAMILSRMMRKLGLECYDYKLMPIELENAYFELKEQGLFDRLTNAYHRTEAVKKHMGTKHLEKLTNNTTSIEMVKTDSRLI